MSLNLCESCKTVECSFRKDGRFVHACHLFDPITIADLAAKDAYWQDRIVRERKETQDLYANGVLTAIAPLAERPCIGATHGTGFVLVGCVWHEESEVRKAAESLGLREPPAVVVPELTDECAEWQALPFQPQYTPMCGSYFAAGYNLARSCAIPADRVLGDGMVAVDRERLSLLTEIEGYVRVLLPGAKLAIQDLDALRANQGGAEHGNG